MRCANGTKSLNRAVDSRRPVGVAGLRAVSAAKRCSIRWSIPRTPWNSRKASWEFCSPLTSVSYQVIAYRYLSGVGLSPAEAVRASSWRRWPRSSRRDPLRPRKRIPGWWRAPSVPGVKPLDAIDAYRQVKKEGYFDSYLNCNDDAFQTAAATLDRVRAKPFAEDWVAAQDQVFGDCSKGNDIPASSSDPQLRPDRAYQIASAKFYSEQYDAAHQDFQSIAADTSSPWHEIAPYVAARCLIRAGKLAEAETELQRVAADPSRPRWHAPANSLLGYVRVRLHPAERMHELALALVKPNSPGDHRAESHRLSCAVRPECQTGRARRPHRLDRQLSGRRQGRARKVARESRAAVAGSGPRRAAIARMPRCPNCWPRLPR